MCKGKTNKQTNKQNGSFIFCFFYLVKVGIKNIINDFCPKGVCAEDEN
jgi:hypothetical protein